MMPENDDLEQYQDRAISTWSKKEKILRVLWSFVEATVFRYSFHNMNRWRAILLRLFGARIGQHTTIRRTVRITIPWHLSLGDWSTLGDHAIVYALGEIKIGNRSTVSQYSHLCAGTHDYKRQDLPLLRMPITIGDECWIGADAFIGPGVTVGNLSVVGARSGVYKDVPAGKVCVGNPAKAIKDRELD